MKIPLYKRDCVNHIIISTYSAGSQSTSSSDIHRRSGTYELNAADELDCPKEKLSDIEHDVSQKEATNANANEVKTKEENICENLSQELRSSFDDNDNFTGENKIDVFHGLKRKNTSDSDTDSLDSTTCRNSYQDFERTEATTEENKKVDWSPNNPLVTDDLEGNEGNDDFDNRDNGDENVPGEVRNGDLKVDVNENIARDRNSNHSASCNSATIKQSDSESLTKADSDENKTRNDSIGCSNWGDHDQEVIELGDIAETKKEAVSSESNESAAETEEVLNPAVEVEIKMAGNDSEELRVLDENENPKHGCTPEDSTDAAVNNNLAPKSNDSHGVALAAESTDLEEGDRLQVPSKDKDVEAGNIPL